MSIRSRYGRGWRRLTGAIGCCAVLAGSLIAGAAHQNSMAAGSHVYRNPVFAQDFPDPAVLKVGADYYAYATSTDWEPLGHLFPILHSRDLVHWRYVGDAIQSFPSWGSGDWWAPTVIERAGMFYMYYVGKDMNSGLHCVAVATAAKPTGPFTTRRVIGCSGPTGQGYIDPAPLLDSGGKAYLYISVDDPQHNISLIPLTTDLLHAAGPAKELFTVSQAWEHGPNFTTVEGPFVIKQHGLYVLLYSGNDWQQDYAMGYATAKSPTGPFIKCGCNPILRGNAKVTGPGGGSVVQGPHGGLWLAYHAWTGGPGYGANGKRTLRIDPLEWKKGELVVRGPTTTDEPAP